MASFDYLSGELIFQILSWLPVISLLQCKSVCKSWKSIISDPHFIEAHLNNSEKRQPFSVLRVAGPKELYIDTRDEDSVRLNLPSYLSGMHHHIRSVNGLVTLADLYAVSIYIWNPLTRLFKLLPPPVMQPIYFSGGFKVTFGFGFDSVSGEYKILRIAFVEILQNDENVFHSLLVAELYSTNSNSWKWISIPQSITVFEHLQYLKCFNTKGGILYFEAKDGILSFDLNNEVFVLYPYPESGDRATMSDILDYNGSLAMILKCGDWESVTSLWILDDADGKFYWTKKFDLEPDLMENWVLFYLGVGQFIVEVDMVDTFGYAFYDGRKEGNKRFSLFAPEGECVPLVQFTESLVSLQGFERRE